MSRSFFDRFAIYGVTAAYMAVSYAALAFGTSVARFVVPEDHYAETIGALSFLAASVWFLLSFRVLRGPEGSGRVLALVVLVLGILFFFAFGEEISWGQRILGIEEPAALERVNAQDELNVHNIEIGQWVVPYERLFDLLWVWLTVVVPLAAAASDRARRTLERIVPIVHWGIGLLFVANYLLAKIAKAVLRSSYSLDDVPFAQAVQEVKESNYALLFALVAACCYAYAKDPRRAREAPSPHLSLRDPANHEVT